MAKKTIDTVKLGLFITMALGLFILAVYLIGSRQNMFGEHLRVSSVFGNVNGLRPGNNVRFSGINVGTVESIELLNDTAVQVNMKLEKSVQPYLKENAIVSIGSDGLVGSMIVNISPGEGAAGLVEEGAVLESYSRLETEEILNTLGKTNENIAVISNDLLRITQQLTKGEGTLALLLRDSSLALSFRRSIHNFQLTSAYFASTAEELNLIIKEVNQEQGLLGQLLYDTTVLANLNTSIDQVDTLAAQLSPTLMELNSVAEDIAIASRQLRSVVRKLQEGEEGLMPRLLHDTAYANRLESILENIDTGSMRFSENMKAMREHILFRRYFKKQEVEKEEED